MAAYHVWAQRKIVLYIAQSLDGYIATKEESLDWLFKVEGEGDNGYAEFYETIDTILLGKRTFDWIMKHREFPYKNKSCYVFSRSPLDETGNIRFIKENIVDFTNNMKNEEGENIWLVGGGDLVHTFLKEKLDELILTICTNDHWRMNSLILSR